jgi:ABC-type transport system involved in cytochrome c biogenesis permease component
VKAVRLIVRKDLRVLGRSPLLLAALVAYPIVIALLVGLVAGYASSKPRVAWVDEDNVPESVQVGGRTFHVQTIIDEVSKNVSLVRMSADEAKRQLDSGEVVATITVPPGFVGTLQTASQSPSLELRTGSGVLASRVTQQVQALVYQLNRELQQAFIKANLAFVDLLLHGGKGSFLGRGFTVLGLDGTEKELAAMPPSERVRAVQNFVRQARIGLAQTGTALEATAHPIVLEQAKEKGRTWVLSAQVQSYGIALTVTFLALLLAAGAIAAERDEGTIARLRRGLVTRSQLVWSKVALATVVGVALGAAIAVVFGVVVEAGGVSGGEPWVRIPLLLVGVALAAAVVGAAGTLLGALAGEARTASLLAVLVVLPVVFVGLVPRFGFAYWISQLLPFAHAVRWFAAALYDASPWRALAVQTAWLLGIGAVLWLLARVSLRRLSA